MPSRHFQEGEGASRSPLKMLTMVEGDQEFNQYFVENYFYTEYGHKDVERAYTKMS